MSCPLPIISPGFSLTPCFHCLACLYLPFAASLSPWLCLPSPLSSCKGVRVCGFALVYVCVGMWFCVCMWVSMCLCVLLLAGVWLYMCVHYVWCSAVFLLPRVYNVCYLSVVCSVLVCNRLSRDLSHCLFCAGVYWLPLLLCPSCLVMCLLCVLVNNR